MKKFLTNKKTWAVTGAVAVVLALVFLQFQVITLNQAMGAPAAADVGTRSIAGAGVTNLTNLYLGDGTAADYSLVYDGNAQDFYMCLDDSADDLVLGLGSTCGTTPALSIDEDQTTTFAGILNGSFADLTVTDGITVTPAYNVYALDSAGAVTITLAAAGTEGQTLILIGDDANTITIADTNIRTSDGAAATLGQYDVIVFVYQDSEWLEISKSANS